MFCGPNDGSRKIAYKNNMLHVFVCAPCAVSIGTGRD